MNAATLIALRVLFLVAAAFSARPAAAAAPAPSTGKADQQIDVRVGQVIRTCALRLPSEYDGVRQLPVVIAIHGAGGSGKGTLDMWRALADEKGFIAACPNGIVGPSHAWNALFGKPIPGGHGAQVDDVDDVGFIRSLIDQMRTSYHADPSRIFVCGHSSGAYMAYRVANDLADRVAAAGIVNGSMGIRLLEGKPSLGEIPAPVAPISILHICGANDGIVKFVGGQTPSVLAKSVPECIAHFVKADGCATPGKETRDAAVIRTLYSGGKAGTEVELVVIGKAGHNWPTANEGFAATQELWDFFARHPRKPSQGAAVPPAKLEPGKMFSITFPDMPPTYLDRMAPRGIKPTMTVFLPQNYDPKHRHPLLIFLGGGWGSQGKNPVVARKLSQEKDFICVELPLFRKVDPPATQPAGILVRDDDCKFAWPLYKTMLAKLDESVPNIDPKHQVLGGFSNGAHMLAGLINDTDGQGTARFSALFLVEGGGAVARFDLLKGKPLMMVCGKWRPNAEKPLAAGVKLTIYYMKNPAHAFPESEYPAARKWLTEALAE